MAREQVKRKAEAKPVEIGKGTLIRGGACVTDDPWRLIADDEAAAEDGDLVVSFGRYKTEREALLQRTGRLGVLIASADAVEEIAGDVERFALVMVQFPAFRDGRGFTTARLLRERYAFKGELRAVGDVLEDQIFYMLRCGFSSFEIIAKDPEAAFERAARTFTHAYQPSADGLEPAHVLRARRRAGVIQFPGARTPIDRAAQMSRDMERRHAREVIAFARAQWGDRFAIVSSFGAESAVLLHLVAAVDRSIPVIFLDTDRHFAQTLQYRDDLVARLKLTNVRTQAPDAGEAAREDAQGTLWRTDGDACCALRKVRPLEQSLQSVEAWATGRKRAQGALRQHLALIEHDGVRYKVNPLAAWAPEDIDAYMAKQKLPRHPLVEQGFGSIGCWPCTQPGEGRSGRWAGAEKTECGIHIPHLVSVS